jgi:hypothetical protein
MMNKMTLLSLIIIILFGCKSEEPNYPIPDAVVLVAKSPDTAAVEQGIDAVPEYNGIQLQWYLLPDRGIKSYNIYRKGPNDTYFKKIDSKPVDYTQISESDTSYLDTVFVDNFKYYQDYFYFVTATSKDNKEGPPSDTVSYQLFEKALPDGPNTYLYESNPVFSWRLNNTVFPDMYILRIEQIYPYKLHYAGRFQRIEYDFSESISLTDTLQFLDEVPALIFGQMYRWRIDCVEENEPYPSGSESNWLQFTYYQGGEPQ